MLLWTLNLRAAAPVAAVALLPARSGAVSVPAARGAALQMQARIAQHAASRGRELALRSRVNTQPSHLRRNKP